MGLNDIRKKQKEDLRKLRKEKIGNFNRAVGFIENEGCNESTKSNLVASMDAWLKVDMQILQEEFFDIFEEG